MEESTPSPTPGGSSSQCPSNSGILRPIPRYLTWSFIPRPIRSLIYTRVILPRRPRSDETDYDHANSNRRFFTSELALRIKHRVLSRHRPAFEAPSLLSTLPPDRRSMDFGLSEVANKSVDKWDPAYKDDPGDEFISADKSDYKIKEDIPHNEGDHKNNEAGAEPSPPDVCAENKPACEDPPLAHVPIPRMPPLPQNTEAGPSPAQYLTAGQAFSYATSKTTELHNILTEFGFEGSYLIQAGFNWEMIGSNQGLLQEIYLFLEYDPDSSNIGKVAAIFEPFPVTIYAPSTTYHHPSHDAEDIWNLWRLRGIFSPELRGLGVANNSSPVDADDNSMKSTGGSATSPNTSDGSREYGNRSEGGGSKEDLSGNSGDNNGGKGHNDEDDDGDDGTIDIPSSAARKTGQDTCNTHEISIPFSSTLTVSGESHQQSARYKTNGSVDITIEGNLKSQSRPPGLNWGGPWLEAKFSFLDAEIHVVPRGNLMFHLGLSQIRIMASGCPSSILSYSPTLLRADGNMVKSTMEKNNSTNLKATIGATPTLQLGGTASQTSSEERSQRRWEVVAHCLNSDNDGITGKSRTTMMWKYIHNDKYYSPESRNVFEPRPSTVFGLSRQSPTMPKLDIEVITGYSWSTPVQRFRDWIAATRIKQKKVFPAFTNFLHQVSVTLDLTKVTERTEWVVGLNAEDRKKMSDIGKVSQPMLRRLESNIGASSCTVRLRRALHGDVSLTEEQRREFKTDPHSLLATAWTDETDDSLASDSLPTPSPSPSPTWPSE